MSERRRVAFVTGSTKGIGLSIVKRLAALHTVLFHGIEPGAADDLAQELNRKGHVAHHITADLGSRTDRAAVFSFSESNKLWPDVLVLNAAIQDEQTLADLTEDSVFRLASVKFTGQLMLIQGLLGRILHQWSYNRCRWRPAVIVK